MSPIPARAEQRQRTSPQRATRGPEAATGAAPPVASPAARLQQTAGNQAMHRLLRAGVVQAKVNVGAIDDDYEREADRMADHVMRMPDPPAAPAVSLSGAPYGAQRGVQRRCAKCEEEASRRKPSETARRAPEQINRMCSECEKEHKHQDDGAPKVHAKFNGGPAVPATAPATAAAAGGATTADSGLESYLAGSRHGGQPLPSASRAFFEPRFGHDFGHVRVHSDGAAARAAAGINARAFTYGSDVYFGAGHLQPGSATGDRLLAHELTHVVQQGQGGPGVSRLSRSPSPAPSSSPTPSSTSSIAPRVQRDGPKKPPAPGPAVDPGPAGGSMEVLLAMLAMAGSTVRPKATLRAPGQLVPQFIDPGAKGLIDIIDALRPILKPPPCKFYLCETYTACKPPDKDEDIWKWWKWTCHDYEVCWCAMRDVPEGTADERLLLTLSAASDLDRKAILANAMRMFVLQRAIGVQYWPLALRILNKASSTVVPSLDEPTWFMADQANKYGHRALALDIVLEALIARRQIVRGLANWRYDPSGKMDAQTLFTLVDDPVTHERRARAPVDVEVYPPAFVDIGWLFSSMMHEYVHVLQVLAGAPASEFDKKGKQTAPFVARDEVESYLWEIEHAVGSGVINNQAQMKELGRRLQSQFAAMTKPLQSQYKARYDAAILRVQAVVAGRRPMGITEARRIVQDSSQEIADLLKVRPGNEAVVDPKIAAIRRRRAEAMVEVALVDNPIIQTVRAGDPGTYRVPTVDAEGRVRYMHGGIQVAWHMAQASTSVYTLGEALGVGGQMAVSGTAVQGRIHPYAPDVDFDEHIHVVASTPLEAGRQAAERIITRIREISGGHLPGRPDIEFRHLATFPKGRGRGIKMSRAEVLQRDAVDRLAPAMAALNGGNMSTFWRGFLADGRFTDVTRVVFLSATKPDGTELITAGGSADFNLAYLEDPSAVPTTDLGKFAWEMCCEAVRRGDQGLWLKAGKRAYNYFSTIGDLTHMAALEPVFSLPQTEVEPWVTAIDGIQKALTTKDMDVPQPATRIFTVTDAKQQVELVAAVVENILPDVGGGTSPATIATKLRKLATFFRALNPRGDLMQDDGLAWEFGLLTQAVRHHIDLGIRDRVKPIVDDVVRPVCPNKDKCRK